MANRTDFNPEQVTDIDVASPPDTGRDAAQADGEKETVRRAIRELELVRDTLSEPDRSDLSDRIDRIQSMLTSGVNPTVILTTMVAVARTEASTYASNEAARTQSIMADAVANLSTASRYSVAQAVDAIMEGDIVVTARKVAERLGDAPEAIKKDAEESALHYLQSEQGKANQEAQRRYGKEPLLSVKTEQKALDEYFLALANDPKLTDKERAFYQHMADSGAVAMPEAKAVLQAHAQGKSFEEIEKAAQPALAEVEKEQVNEIRRRKGDPDMAGHVSHYKAHAPQHVKNQLNDETAIVKDMNAFLSTLSPEDRKAAYEKFVRNGSRTEGLSEKDTHIIDAIKLHNSLYAATTDAGTIRTLELMHGQSLSVEQEAARNKVYAAGGNLMERVDIAARAVMDQLPESQRNIERGKVEAALVLTFADTHGGMQRYEDMKRRQGVATESGTTDAQAAAYFQELRAYSAQKLNVDPASPSFEVQYAYAMDQAALLLKQGDITLRSTADGALSVSNAKASLSSAGYERSTFFESAFASDYLGYKTLNDTLYQRLPGGQSIDWADDRSVAIGIIDTTRLYNTAEGKKLVNGLANGSIPAADALQRAEALADVETRRMSTFSPAISQLIAQEDPTRYAYLKDELGVVKQDGAIDPTRLMMEMMKAKKAHGDELALTDGPAGMVYQTASQFYATQAVDQVRELGNYIKETYAKAAQGGSIPDALINDEILYATLMNSSGSVTPKERDAALRELLQRDEYVAKNPALLDNTVAMMGDYLKTHPDYFGKPIALDEPAKAPPSVAPATQVMEIDGIQIQVTVIDTATPAAAKLAQPNSQYVIESGEGLVPESVSAQAAKPDMQAAVKAALAGLSTKVLVEKFGAVSADPAKLTPEAIAAAAVKAVENVGQLDGDRNGSVTLDEIAASAIRAQGAASTAEKSNAR